MVCEPLSDRPQQKGFFLLQDLCSGGGGQVRFFLPNNGFEGSPYPADLSAYRSYRDAVTEFVKARNYRIAGFSLSQMYTAAWTV
jgi:hypothetical protein